MVEGLVTQPYQFGWVEGYNAGFAAGAEKFSLLIILLFASYLLYTVVTGLKRRGYGHEIDFEVFKLHTMGSLENALFAFQLMVVSYLFITLYIPPLLIQ